MKEKHYFCKKETRLTFVVLNTYFFHNETDCMVFQDIFHLCTIIYGTKALVHAIHAYGGHVAY